GKPYALVGHVRFDKGEALRKVSLLYRWVERGNAGKRGETVDRERRSAGKVVESAGKNVNFAGKPVESADNKKSISLKNEKLLSKERFRP
ncbi:hypothetical protein, partial [Neobacillus muris]|uniref:hypothetical protein n=1 Tax=Neobacillus muris TaxID=2941334 RepID=UPI00203EE575